MLEEANEKISVDDIFIIIGATPVNFSPEVLDFLLKYRDSVRYFCSI